MTDEASATVEELPRLPAKERWNTEDWWAVAIGAVLLLSAFLSTFLTQPDDVAKRVAAVHDASATLDSLSSNPAATEDQVKAAEKSVVAAQKSVVSNPLSPWIAKLSGWSDDPSAAFVNKQGQSTVVPLLVTLASLGLLFGLGSWALGRSVSGFVPGFVIISVLAVLAEMMASQQVIKHYNLEYALWALLVGLLISNTVGTPKFLLEAANTEFYIKTGLVLLGAEVLFHRLLALGLPGVFVSWVVTPVVLISTYVFGQKILKLESRSLNMVISADMSVCGVSAAIATAAACKAKKEELSLAIGLSLVFTVIMMVVMPGVIRATGMSEVLGGAWLGGTIDSTGAVAAAGGMIGPVALEVAATVKMIQNILIGAVAFGVAVYWVTYVERTEKSSTPRISEIWKRFPRFILGFVVASIVFSILSAQGTWGDSMASAVINGTTKTLRGWCFCLAFVSIGLETNFRELSQYLRGGKPLILYVTGQSLNLLLTLLMAWLMFEIVFPEVAQTLAR